MAETRFKFDAAFQALTDYLPMRWQVRLFERLMQGKPTHGCDLPTGLGKTSVIPIWLIALASQASNESIRLPRRLIYIVNRRTVVDQATGVVERMRSRLLDPDNPSWQAHTRILVRLTDALSKLSAGLDDLPVAISTLRGELADNEEWKVDPARPAIIVGTIDMIGSKLLFSGYGDGKYHRTHHAGLVGQDVLIVHDEAHLTLAFSDLLRSVTEAQCLAREQHPVQVLELSATVRDTTDDMLTLEPEDEKDEIVQQRLDAKKRLYLHKAAKDAFASKLAVLAQQHEKSSSRVLIYVRTPETAYQVVQALANKLGSDSAEKIALLTGTMRGTERDQLVRENPVYGALLNPNPNITQSVYLVSTSAGEVGIDLDADHLVSDLTTFDSIIQRFGRVNRRGGKGRVAKVDVVAEEDVAVSNDESSVIDKAIQATRTLLKRLPSITGGGHDASPRRLRELLKGLEEKDKNGAFSPKPETQRLTDILLDAWSLTSIREPMPGRPEVQSYLHGLTSDPPETYVGWRREVALLGEAQVNGESLRDWFRACRVDAQERLRDRTDRVKNALQALLAAHRKADRECDFPVILLNERGEVQWRENEADKALWLLSEIIDFNLTYRTVLLPVEAGGLTTQGTLDGRSVDPASDVAEAANDADRKDRRERWLLVETEDGSKWERLLTGETATIPPTGLRELERVTLQAPTEGAEGETGARHLVLMVSPKQSVLENPEIARTKQTLEQHSEYIEGCARDIAKALRLDRKLAEALAIAAWWHDQGKARPVWQRFACNANPDEILAKSTKYLHGRALGGYRHESGSLLDAAANETVRNHPECDLILHLIAAHHGWARPHFETNAWDPTHTTRDNEQAAAEVMRRFGRLQQRFGRWGLAWLESLLRCSDIAASRPSVATPAPTRPEELQA